MTKKAKRFILTALLGAGVLFAVRWYWGHVWQQITVTTEVTHITSPLRDDGTVDYLAALNERYSAGVTHDNNAAISLLMAIGAQEYGQTYAHDLSLALRAPELETTTADQKLVSITSFRLKRMPRHPYDGEEEMHWTDEVTDLGKQPWKTADHAEVAAWLASCQPVLARITSAAQLRHYYIPAFAGSGNDTVLSSSIGPASMVRTHADILAARAMLRLGAGDLTGCREDGLTILRLGYLDGQQPSAIDRLVSYAVIDVGLRVYAAMLESRAMSPVQAREFRGDLAALPEIPSYVECLDVYQRYEALDQITFLARFGPDGDARSHRANSFTFGLTPVHFDRVLREANNWTDRFVKAAATTPFAAREAAVAGVSGDAATYLASAGSTHERALRTLITLFCGDMLIPLRLRDYTRQRREVVVAGYAARSDVSGTSTAAELDQWTRTLPPDIFSGNPLHADLVNTDGHVLLLGCAGPPPLPRRSLVISGVDISGTPAQKSFGVKVRLSD